MGGLGSVLSSGVSRKVDGSSGMGETRPGERMRRARGSFCGELEGNSVFLAERERKSVGFSGLRGGVEKEQHQW